MANLLLFKSSCYLSYIYVIFIINYHPINNYHLLYSIYCGLVSSILNHYYTNLIIKYLDRLTMYYGFIYTLYLLYILKLYYYLILLLLCSQCYLISKYMQYKLNTIANKKIKKVLIHNYIIYTYYPHLLSHILLTIIHIKLLNIYAN